MEPVPSLREVFAALAGGSTDPSSALSAAGHGDLPGDLVAEAIVNYADAAPIEVAEHLSPFVIAHSAVPQGDEAPQAAPDTADGLDLLAGAPAGPEPAAGHEHNGLAELDGYSADGTSPGDEPAGSPTADVEHQGPDDLSFGAGEPGSAGSAPEAGHPVDDIGHDPAELDSAASSGGNWLDVTSPGLDSVEQGTDWHHDSADTGQIEVPSNDEPGDGDGLAGADI